MESFLFKLDPRTKILMTPLLSVLVFITNKLPVAAGLLLCLLLLARAARMPFKKFGAYLKLLFFLTAFITALQVFFGPGEGLLKRQGLVLGLLIGCRIASLMLLLPMLAFSTAPQKLALGLTRLRFNYRAAYILTAAFNLIPAFEEEARGIMDAQRLRGLRAFEEGRLTDKFKAYPALALPLIIGAMRRAQEMGIAMDARGFGAYKTKVWLENITMGAADYAAFAVCLVFSALAFIVSGMLP